MTRLGCAPADQVLALEIYAGQVDQIMVLQQPLPILGNCFLAGGYLNGCSSAFLMREWVAPNSGTTDVFGICGDVGITLVPDLHLRTL